MVMAAQERGSGLQAPLRSTARSASPAVQRAAPTSSRSFIRKPCHSGDRLGVVNRKLRVIRKAAVAPRLPTTDARGHQGRTARRTASVNSSTPIRLEAPWTLVTAYSQPRKGLLATQG